MAASPAGNDESLPPAMVTHSNPDWTMDLQGYTILQYGRRTPASGAITSAFDMGITRVAASGVFLDPRFSYLIQMHASTSGDRAWARLLDGAVFFRPNPRWQITAGRTVLHNTFQITTAPANWMMTGPAPAELAFGFCRALGLQVAHNRGRVTLRGAAVNSVRGLDSKNFWDAHGPLAWMGRVEVDLMDHYGHVESSPEPISQPQWSVGMAGAYNPTAEASAHHNVLPHDRNYTMTADSGFRAGRLSAQGAFYSRRIRYAGTSSFRPGHDWGTYGQAGFYVVPRKWEATGRISMVELARPNHPQVTGDGEAYTLGLNRYFMGHGLKVQFNYSFLRQYPFDGPRRWGRDLRVSTQIWLKPKR